MLSDKARLEILDNILPELNGIRSLMVVLEQSLIEGVGSPDKFTIAYSVEFMQNHMSKCLDRMHELIEG